MPPPPPPPPSPPPLLPQLLFLYLFWPSLTTSFSSTSSSHIGPGDLCEPFYWWLRVPRAAWNHDYDSVYATGHEIISLLQLVPPPALRPPSSCPPPPPPPPPFFGSNMKSSRIWIMKSPGGGGGRWLEEANKGWNHDFRLGNDLPNHDWYVGENTKKSLVILSWLLLMKSSPWEAQEALIKEERCSE